MAHACNHCKKTGTCRNGKDEAACDYCADTAGRGGWFTRGAKITSPVGLPCAICGGLGQADVHTNILLKRLPLALALAVVFCSILIIGQLAFVNKELHVPALTLLGSLSASVIGYYFGGRTVSSRVTKE